MTGVVMIMSIFFYLTYDAINAIKKKDRVDYIEKIKGNVVTDKQI